MINNYIINVNIATTKPIKIEKIDSNIFIYDKEIDGYNIKQNDRILVKDQTSHYYNNLYIVRKNISGYKFLCSIFDKKNDLSTTEKKAISNQDIFLIKYGIINSNIYYVKSNNIYTIANIYTKNIDINIKKLKVIKNTILLRNSEFISLNKLYSIYFYLYYFKPIEIYNITNDNNIITELINNKYLNVNKIIISSNKKYFLTINDNGYLVLYLNNYNNNNINTIKPIWLYPCDSLKNKELLFDDNNNLQIIENYSLNKININQNSYKYKGTLINQGPNFNTLNFNSLSVNIPNKIELYENDKKQHIYINSDTLESIELKFNKNDNNIKKLRLLKVPHPNDILSDSFRPSLNLILQKIEKQNINNINNLKEFIYRFIKTDKTTINIEQKLSTFLDKDQDKELIRNNIISEKNLMLFIDIIINYINNNNIIIPPKYYIFDNPNISNFPANMLDNNNKQTKYFFKLERSNNLQISKNIIIINNQGQIIQSINNSNIKVWNTINNTNSASNIDTIDRLLKEYCFDFNNINTQNTSATSSSTENTSAIATSTENSSALTTSTENPSTITTSTENPSTITTSTENSPAITTSTENSSPVTTLNQDSSPVTTLNQDSSIVSTSTNDILINNSSVDDIFVNNNSKTSILFDKNLTKDEKLTKINNNIIFNLPFISTNYISSNNNNNDYKILYNKQYNYILINNNYFKINTYLQKNNIYYIYLVHSIPNINNYNINKILNIKKNININIQKYSINEHFKLKDYKNNDLLDKYISNKLHISYIEFSVSDDIYELNIFDNDNNDNDNDNNKEIIDEKYIFNLHNILICTKLNTQEKINIFKYLNKKWSVYLTNNKNYNSEAYDYILYNNKVHCNISCINIESYKNKKTGIYNDVYDNILNIKIDFCINYKNYNIENNLSIETLFNNIKTKLYSDNILTENTKLSNIFKFIKNDIISLKDQDFDNNLLYQFKHFLPYIKIKNIKLIDYIDTNKYDISEENITINDILLELPNIYSEKFIILVINQKYKYNNGIYIRNYDNTITKLILDTNKFNDKMFIYNSIYDKLNMSNIIINKLQKSNIFFQLYQKKYDPPISINLNKYTKTDDYYNICFDFFMLDYIENYHSINSDLLYVDLASNKHFNINKSINLINLPDINKEGCTTCNIYNFLKIKKNNLYILLKNQKNPVENGIYLYSFKKNDILKLQYKIEFSDKNNSKCSNKQYIFVLNGINNQNSFFEYSNKIYKLIKQYDPKTCNL